MSDVSLSDGRRLAYEFMGDRDGSPIVVLHGTPGSRKQLLALDSLTMGMDVALIVPDRPGYGASTHDPSRSIASSAHDIAELIRHLEIDGCSVVGLSGGGPTALACGVVAAEQVGSVATVGGVAPLIPRHPSLPADRLTIRLARWSETATRLLFAAIMHAGRVSPDRTVDRFTRLLSEPDAQLLVNNSQIREGFLADLRDPSPTAAKAAARDFRTFVEPWDFDLSTISVPVHIWHGTEDRNVPVQHAHVLSQACPGAHLHLVEEGGHMLLTQLEEIIGQLRASSA